MNKKPRILFKWLNISWFLSVQQVWISEGCSRKRSEYWEYKLVRSVFLYIYFKIKWMNRSIKVLSIAAYYFFLFLRQFSNSISKKWLVFGGNPILEPIFNFCERNEPVTCQIVLHPLEQPVIRRSNVRRIRRMR